MAGLTGNFLLDVLLRLALRGATASLPQDAMSLPADWVLMGRLPGLSPELQTWRSLGSLDFFGLDAADYGIENSILGLLD